jgi:lysophospholipase L1-like esterase
MSKPLIIILLLIFLVACSPVKEVQNNSIGLQVNEYQVQVQETQQAQAEQPPAEQAEQLSVGIINNETSVQNVSEEIQNVSEVNTTTPVINETIPVIINQTKIIKSIAFGDSLTFGEGINNKNKTWVALVTNQNVNNYAVTGATTADVLNQIKQIKDEKQAFLWIGSNDAGQLVQLNTFESNYRTVVDTILKKNMTLIILNIPDATKLEISDQAQRQLNDYLKSQYGMVIDAKPLVRQYTSLYNNIIQTIADENNVKVINMFDFMNSFSSDLITSDQFHPNEKGHLLIANYVKEQIK